MKRCPKCKKEYADDIDYCGKCGKKLRRLLLIEERTKTEKALDLLQGVGRGAGRAAAKGIPMLAKEIPRFLNEEDSPAKKKKRGAD